MPSPLPQILAGAAYTVWAEALEHPETGILVRCVTLAQAYSLRKNLYSVRLRERKTNETKDLMGNPIPGRSAWDNLSTVMCFDPEGTSYKEYQALGTDPSLLPKAEILILPAFIWIGPATIQLQGLEVFHPKSGERLLIWNHIPKLPPRVVDKGKEIK